MRPSGHESDDLFRRVPRTSYNNPDVPPTVAPEPSPPDLYPLKILTELRDLKSDMKSGLDLLTSRMDDLTSRVDDLTSRVEILESPSRREGSSPKQSASLKWIEDKNIQPAKIQNGRLFFVNRKIAVDEMIPVLESGFINRQSMGGGSVHRIPIVYSGPGNGITTFLEKFITCLTRSDIFKRSSDDFRRSLSNSETIIIQWKNGSVLTSLKNETSKCDRLLLDMFNDEVGRLIETGYLVGTGEFIRKERHFAKAVRKFIDTTRRPLFLVFVNVQRAFSDSSKDIEDQRKIFADFCMKIIAPLLIQKDLFVCLGGNGNLFEWVGSTTSLFRGSLELTKITLNPIGSKYVEKIIRNTYFKMSDKDKSLAEYYGIENQDEIDLATRFIMMKTNGHPSSMLKMLRRCSSLADLANYCDNCPLSPFTYNT